MLINASHPEENRVAIVVDGALSELDIELAGQEQARGNIYKAVVVRVETGLQAAFVDYGADKLGFLQISEIHPGLYPARGETTGRPRITDILHRGQDIMVQIVKEERGNKGAALTTFLSLPGRYMVLMPDSTTKGVSRKISEETQRKTLKKTMAELNLPEQMGYIVRTAGIGKEKEELKRDFDYLVRLFEGIVQRQAQVKAPAHLYQESSLAIRSIRDYFTTDMDEVLIDDEKVYNDAKDFFALVMPEHTHLVKRHRERRPIFSRYQIEEQIDTLSRNQVFLPSGGSIVIDPTEALVAIDVNSGKLSSESGIEATALKTNLEAAGEIGRQLRLRDLGGLIVIDFIDMRERKHNREVEQELRKALKNDKARVSVGKISQFGLLEMSRQRIKPVLSVGSYHDCPHCHGLGKIKSVEAQAVRFLRQVHTAAAKGQVGHIEAHVPHDVANYLLNKKRATIGRLEELLDLQITILGQPGMLSGDLTLETFRREKDATAGTEAAPVSHANQIESALAEARTEQEQDPMESMAEQPETAAAQAETTVSQEDPEEPTAENAPAKKRRRRRRKKPAASTGTPTIDSPQSTQEPDQQGTAVDIPEPATEAETKAQLPGEPPDGEQQIAETNAPTKPKRRSRRARKTATASADANITAPATEPSPATEEDPGSKTEQQPTDTAQSSSPETVTTTANKKQQQRRRKTTAKKTPGSDQSTLADPANASWAAEIAQPDETPSASSASTVEEPAAIKPARKPRATTKKAQVQTPEDPALERSEPSTPDQQPADIPAPKRPRRSRKAATTKTATATDNDKVQPDEKVAAVAETEESKNAKNKDSKTTSNDEANTPVKKPQRRRRSTTAKKPETAIEPDS